MGNFKSISILLLATLIFTSCGRTTKLTSQRSDNTITIDGDRLDWAGKVVNVEDNYVRMGAVNDDENLYLSLIVSNRALGGMIMNKGLVFWIGKANEEKRQNGFRYPIGMEELGGMDPSGMAKLDADGRRLQLELALKDVELLAEPGLGRRYDRKGLAGISVESDAETGVFFIEMKVPLRSKNGELFEVGADPGDEIVIFAEVPDLGIGPSSTLRQGDGARGGSSGPGGFSSAGRRTNRGHMSAPGGAAEALSETLVVRLVTQ